MKKDYDYINVEIATKDNVIDKTKVFLNGEEANLCYEACVSKGYVIVADLDRAGRLQEFNEGIAKKRLWGKVQIVVED